MSRRTFSNYCPVSADTHAYLDREDREPETERARCACGRFFSREVDQDPTPYRLPEQRCPACARDHRAAIAARNPVLRSTEAGRAAHIAMGSLAPVRRQG